VNPHEAHLSLVPNYSGCSAFLRPPPDNDRMLFRLCRTLPLPKVGAVSFLCTVGEISFPVLFAIAPPRNLFFGRRQLPEMVTANPLITTYGASFRRRLVFFPFPPLAAVKFPNLPRRTISPSFSSPLFVVDFSFTDAGSGVRF